MKIFARYLIREQVKMLFLFLGAFLTIFLVVEAFERTSTIISQKAPLYLGGLYLLYVIPLYLIQSLPFVLLMATMVALGIMGKNRELMAIKVHGVGNYSIVFPLLLVATIVAGVIFIGNEAIIPYSMKKADYIWSVKIKGEEERAFFCLQRIWYRGKGTIYNIRLLDAKRGTMQGVTIFYLDRDMQLVRRVDASKAQWKGGGWEFYDVTIREFSPEGEIKTKTYKRKRLPLKESLADLQKGAISPEQMSYGELLRYVKKLEKEGYNATRFKVDLYAKVAFPFLSLIMVIIGAPLALLAAQRREGGIALGIIMSLVVGGAYWLAFAIGLALGRSGLLPPTVAVWAPNLFFAAAGFYILESLPY